MKTTIKKSQRVGVSYFPFTSNTDEKNVRKDLLRNPQAWLKKHFTPYNFGSDNLQQGFYKEMGFYYIVRPFLTRFLYRKYGSWHEVYAINKTHLRQIVGGRIEEIKSL